MVDKISQLRAEAEMVGADQYVAKATAMARANQDLGKAAEAMGVSSEQANVTIVNASPAFERYRLRVDAAARAERDLERVRRAGQAAIDQGRASQEQVNETIAAYERKLEQARATAERSYGVVRAETKEAADVTRRYADEAENATRATGRLDESITLLKRTAAALGIAFSVAGLISTFNATEDRVLANERALARLNAQLAVTGGAVGKSLTDIQRLAREIEAQTGVAEQTILDRAAALTTFTTIAGEQFDRTMRVAVDMAEVYGQDLKSALEAVGRAMEQPLKGMGMLEKQGFRLEESQKAQIKVLLDQNRQYEAQEIILRMLEELVGGTAAAAYQGLQQAQDQARLSGQRLLEQWYEQSNAAGASEAVWRAAGQTFEWLALNTTALGDAAQFAALSIGGLLAARSVVPVMALLTSGATATAAAIFNFAVANNAYTASSLAAAAATRGFSAAVAFLGGPLGALLAVVGVGTAAWLTYGRALDTSSEAVERNRRVMEELTQKVEAHGFASVDDAKFALRRAEASEALTKSLIREAEAELTLAEARSAGRNERGGALGVSGVDITADVNAARVAALRERLNELGGESDANLSAIAGIRAEIERLGKASDNAADKTNELTDAQKRALKEQERREEAGRNFIRDLDREVTVLEMKVAGQEALIPLYEAELRLRDILNRELLPEEIEKLRQLTEQRRALNETIRQREKAEREAREAEERAAREWERMWNRAADNIQDALVDSFRNGRNAASAFKDFVIDMAWQLAAALVFRPIIAPVIASAQAMMGGPVTMGGGGGLMPGGGGFSFEGISNLFNMQSTLGTSFVNSGIGQWLGLSYAPASGIGPIGMTGLGQSIAGIGNFLGAGGIGFGVGSLFSSFGIGNQTGSQIGGALGGAVGSIIPGVGTIIGSIAGSLIGGLFGNDKPSNNFAMRTISTGDWSIGDPIFDPKERSQGTIDATMQMAEAFRQSAQALLALTGGTGPAGAFVVAGERDGFQVGVGREGIHLFNAAQYGKMGSFGDPQKAIEWMIAEFAKGITGVEDENFRKALAYGGSYDTIIGNLEFVQRLNALTDDGSMALVNALKNVNQQFDEMAKQATTLGIATDELEAARRREIAATRAQVEAQIAGLQQQATNAATQYFAQTLDPLTQFRDSVLRQGALSNMSSRDQFLYAQSVFQGLDLSTARASDIVAAGQTYLTQARAYGASGETFTTVFREVNEVIGRLIDQREEDKRGFEALGVIFQTSTADQTAALKESIGELMEEVRKLRKAQERAA